MYPGVLASTLGGHDRTAATRGSQSGLLVGLWVWGARAIPMLSIYTKNSHQLYILPFGICHMQWGLSKLYQINEQFMNITFNLGCVALNNSIAYPIAEHDLHIPSLLCRAFQPQLQLKGQVLKEEQKWFYKWVYIERYGRGYMPLFQQHGSQTSCSWFQTKWDIQIQQQRTSGKQSLIRVTGPVGTKLLPAGSVYFSCTATFSFFPPLRIRKTSKIMFMLPKYVTQKMSRVNFGYSLLD